MSFEFIVLKHRSVMRKLKFPIRRDSYPFISGDAYRIRCDADLTNLDFNQLFSFDLGKFITVFLPVGRFQDFLQWIKDSGQSFPSWNLVIHNGDFQPIESEIEILSRSFKKIFSVNWLGPIEFARPIPIGLENRRLLRNGVPKDFLKLRGFLDSKKREIKVLAIFKESNNSRERKGLTSRFSSVPGSYASDKFQSPMGYKRLLLKSEFVISPPGNGVDCHRTWEAMYLGCNPVVLKRAWPFAHLELPVLIAADWDDAIEMIPRSKIPLKISPEEIWEFFMQSPFNNPEDF